MGPAQWLLDKLRPTCERLVFAGSIRRRCTLVGDIELLAIPKIQKRAQVGTQDLFGPGRAIYEHVNLLWEATDAIASEYSKRGEKYRQFRVTEFTVDIFTAELGNWGNQLMIRTGSAEFSKSMMVRLNNFGLTSVDGYITQRHNRVRIPTPTEEDVFEKARVPWILPEKRSL